MVVACLKLLRFQAGSGPQGRWEKDKCPNQAESARFLSDYAFHKTICSFRGSEAVDLNVLAEDIRRPYGIASKNSKLPIHSYAYNAIVRNYLVCSFAVSSVGSDSPVKADWIIKGLEKILIRLDSNDPNSADLEQVVRGDIEMIQAEKVVLSIFPLVELKPSHPRGYFDASTLSYWSSSTAG